MNSDFFDLQPSKEFSAVGDLHLERAKAWNVANKACYKGNLESHSSEAKIQAYLQQYHHHLFFKWAIFSLLVVIIIVCLVAFIILFQIWYLGFLISFILLIFIIFARRAYWELYFVDKKFELEIQDVRNCTSIISYTNSPLHKPVPSNIFSSLCPQDSSNPPDVPLTPLSGDFQLSTSGSFQDLS
ncbi:hypothetical protein DSO57_1025150 [Entomophthora muscae]|uniref:Uncharacterized protein n=1 Tax=Entomophthora muscae TaxID=34485 RepID=A0ACC2TQA0_9FUNG|nr:hypothetical protein DSO57_1025150 [Entomophthora muscae]